MSKGNMLLGHARGKVGDLVFSRVNGEQVTRARAAVVHNPKTEAQMIQRIILNTVAQAYSRMQEITDHSFEGVPTGQKSMSAFMRKNLALLRQHVATEHGENGREWDDIYSFSPIGTNVFAAANYVLSTGTLPPVTPVELRLGAHGVAVEFTSTLSYQNVIDSLGLQRGDQLTFVAQRINTNHTSDFRFVRVILDPRNEDGSEASLAEPFLSGETINKPSPRNEGDYFAFGTQVGYLTFKPSDAVLTQTAVIVSRQRADGSWLRSNAAFNGDIDSIALSANEYSLGDALSMLADGGLDLPSDRYLNNARRLTSAAGNIYAGAYQGSLSVVSNGQAMFEGATAEDLVITRVGVSGSGEDQRVVVYDSNGQMYYLIGNSSYNVYNRKLLMSMSGTQNTAWSEALDSGNYGLDVPAIGVFIGGNQEAPVNDFTSWLAQQGVNMSVFVNQ